MSGINTGRLGIICTPEDYARWQADPNFIQCLTRGESIGLTVRRSFISITIALP
jgi:hypothetical protein